MEPKVCRATPASAGGTGRATGGRYDDNRNGKITCKEARRHGIAPAPGRVQRTGTCGTGTGTE